MYRKQGKDWKDLRSRITEVLGYFENIKNGRIKVFVKIKNNPNIFYHWLNNTEREKFEKRKHEYPTLNDKAEPINV